MESAVVLTTVMKGVADALRLDGDGNRPKEAYVKYLECILRITTKLLQNIKTDNGQVHITKEVVRFVRLGVQCMERTVAIVNQFTQDTSSGCRRLAVNRSESHPHPVESKSAPTTPMSDHQSMDLNGQENRFRLASSPASLPPPITGSQSKQKYLKPSEVAMMKNHQLMNAYKARIESLGTRKSAAASLSLTLQRKMAENLAIAKAQEEALEKKIKERQHRLEEQAARKFSNAEDMTAEEEQKKEIYKKVLEYEQDTSWLADMRGQLEENPEDASLMQQVILGILKCSDHPLTQQLKLYQFKMYEKIHPLVFKKMEYLSEIKVPLSPSLFPPGVAEHWDDGEGGGSDSDSGAEEEEIIDVFSDHGQNVKEDEDESLEVKDGRSKTDNGDEKDKEANVKVTEKNLDDICDEKDKEENVKVTEKDMDEICDEVKEDLKEAIVKGEVLKTKLKEENKKVSKILRKVSNDFEKYNLENMDDLFDDDDDEEDDVDDKWLPPPYSSIQTSDTKTSDQSKMDNSNSDQSETLTESCDTPKSSRPQNLSPNRRHSSNTTNKLIQRPKVEHVHAMEEKLACMKNEAYHRHLKGISEDVQISLEKIQALFTMVYDQLDSPVGQDLCYACLEKPFFQPIWQYLVALYRLANQPKEVAVAYVMTRHQYSSPKDFNVSKKLCLRDPSHGQSEFPYQPAVAEIQAITTQYTLLDKLECLVRSSRLICQCIEDYYKDDKENGGKVPTVGADDLLPILCYVIVKAAQPQIVSECHIMEEFIHEGYIMGEEGYCLTSLQTALAYLISLGMVD